MGRVDGKVAFITGASRGQGRSHAVRLAQEGADIIAVDIAQNVESVPTAMGTPDDMAETVRLVEAAGRRIVAEQADIRDLDGLRAALSSGVERLGRLDIVVANAGIYTVQKWDETTPEIWQRTIDINLTGTWQTCQVSIPHLIESGGGSIVIINSVAGIKGLPFMIPYGAAKAGQIGLMRALANELGPHQIRVNTVHPGDVRTKMNEGMAHTMHLFEEHPSYMALMSPSTPDSVVQEVEISHAVVYLASDEARMVTGTMLPVDGGMMAR